MSQIFREADAWHDPKRMHPTFRGKPLVENQAVAAYSRMNSTSGVKSATVNDSKPAPVPTTWDTNYDPSHPKADWAGNYSTDERSHYSGHRSMQSGIIQESDGFVSREQQPMWASKRRGNASVLNSTPGLIGGIGCDDSSAHYKTVAQRQAEREVTNSDQYTLAKRSMHAGKRPIINAAQGVRSVEDQNRNNGVHSDGTGQKYRDQDDAEEEEAYQMYQQQMAQEAASASLAASSQSQTPAPRQQENLIGYRAPSQTMSFTKSLAASIAQNSAVASQITASNYVPVKDRKDLEVINRPIPGYTGYRRGQIN